MHWTCIGLQGMRLSVINILSETPAEKANLFFASELSAADSFLGKGRSCVHFPLPA